MATATVGSPSSSQPRNHLHAEAIPVVDLRLLSQSELHSLSLCTSSTSSLRHLQNDTDVFTPKIDRSVFNESAGSRKQTFSRLRLAPRSTSQFAQSSSNYRLTRPIPAQSAVQYLVEENSQIVSLLKCLFGADSYANVEENENDSNLVSVPVQFQDYLCLPSTRDVELRNAPVGAVSSNIADYSLGKRKRGRPRKNENNVSYGNAINHAIRSEDKETECKMVENAERGNMKGEEMAMVNKNGMMVDLAAVQNAQNAYEEELRRRTEGLRTETEFLGFLEGLEGQWMSKRKKRRIVDASTFGDALPIRWKLVLCLQRRTCHFWLSIRRYISPNGQQFMSCKDVSSHLLSCCNLQGESKVAGLTVRGDKDGAVLSLMFPSTSMSTEHEELASSLMTHRTGDVQICKKYKCHKCTMAFDEEDDLLQHLVLSHQRVPKRFRSEMSLTEEVILKNHKYECQFCHKTFEERHHYNGHLGNHIKDYLKRVKASGGVSRVMPASVRAHSDISGMQESIRIEKDSVAIASIVKTSNETCSASPLCKKQESASGGTDSDMQGRVYDISNGRVEKTNEVTDAVAAETMFGSCAESALLDRKNNTILRSSNETDSFNSTIYGTGNFDGQEKGLQNYSLTSPRRVKACIVENNIDQIGEQNIEGMPMSSAIEDMKIDSRNSVDEDKPIMGLGNHPTVQEGAVTSITEDFSVYGSANKENQSINSMGRDSKEALFSYVDEKAFIFSNNLANVSKSVINEFNFVEIAKSGDNEQTASVGRVVPAPIENIMGSYGSCLVNPYFKEQMLVENDVEGKIKFTIKKTYEPKSERIQHTLFDGEQTFCLENNEVNVSNKLMEVPKQVPWPMKSDGGEIGPVTGSETNVDMAKSSHSCITVPSTNKQVFSAEDSEVCNRTLDKPMLERSLGSNLCRQNCDGKVYGGNNNMNKGSCITLEEHEHEEDKASFNDEVHTAFGHGYTKRDADAVTSSVKGTCSKGYSLATSGNQQPFATEDNKPGLCSCSMDYLKGKRGPIEDLICFLGTKEVKVVEDNGHFACISEAKPGSEDLGSSRSNEFAIDFDRHESHDQPKETVTPNFKWRTDGENDIVLGLAPSSSLSVQSPGYLATSDLLSGKWQDEDEILHGRFTDASGTEMLSLGSMGNIESNLLTSQTSSRSDGSKVFSYDAEIAQGFDLSFQYEKEVLPLLPKEKNSCFVTTICASCRNESYHEAFETEIKMGSMKYKCAACKGQAL